MLRNALIAALMAATLMACEDQNGAANKLLVEASALVEQARKTAGYDAPGAYRAMRDAEAKLLAIVERYPSSELAARLASGQAVGAISLASVSNAVGELAISACRVAPDVQCLTGALGRMALSFQQPLYRATGLADAAKAAYAAGETAAARRYLDLAAEAAYAISAPDDRVAVVALIATLEASWGNKEGVAKHVAALEAEIKARASSADDSRRHLVSIHIANGAVATTPELASGIRDPFERAWAHAAIAEALKAKGDTDLAAEAYEKALAAAARVSTPHTRASVYTNVARGLGSLGNHRRAGDVLALALESARQSERYHRITTFCALASAEAEIGRREAALRVADEALATQREWRERPSVCLVQFHIKAGSLDVARALAAEVEDWDDRVAIEAAFAKAEVEQGDRHAALQRIRKIIAERERLEMSSLRRFYDVVDVMATMGETKGVRRALGTVTATADRCDVLALLARAHLTAGEKAEAIAAASEILSAVPDGGTPLEQLIAVEALAEVLLLLR